MNVWAPADRADAASLPVLVFVHGGALTRGTAASGGHIDHDPRAAELDGLPAR